MRSIDRIDRAVDENEELAPLPIAGHLSTEELDAAVAAQLEQRIEQGFVEVPLAVLSRVARIVETVRWKEAASGATQCCDEQAVLGRAA